MINYYYYIEVKHEDSIVSPVSKVIINPEDVPYYEYIPKENREKAYAIFAYAIWQSYCDCKKWYHYTFRVKYNNDCIHYLIAEKYSKYNDTWYYTTYREYKNFANLLGFYPDQKEKTA